MSMSKEQKQEEPPYMDLLRFAEEQDRKRAAETKQYEYWDQQWKKREAQERAQRILDDPKYDYLPDSKRLELAIHQRNSDPDLIFPSLYWKRVPANDAFRTKDGVLMQVTKTWKKGEVHQKTQTFDEYQKNKYEKKGKQAKLAARGIEYRPTVVTNPETFHMSQIQKEKFQEEEKRKEKVSKNKPKVTNYIYQSIAMGIEEDPKYSKKNGQKEARLTSSGIKRECKPRKMEQERKLPQQNIKKEIFEKSSQKVKKEEKAAIRPRYKTSVKIEYQNPQESANTKAEQEEYTFTPSRNRMKQKEEQEERQARLNYQNELNAIQNFVYSEDEEEKPKPTIKNPLRKKSEGESYMENHIDTAEPPSEEIPNTVQEKVIQQPRKENDEKKKQKTRKRKKIDDLVMYFTTKLLHLEEKAKQRNQLNHPEYLNRRTIFEKSLKSALLRKDEETTLTDEQRKKRAEQKRMAKKKIEETASSKKQKQLSEKEQIDRRCKQQIQEIFRKGDEARKNFQTLMASHGPDNVPSITKAAYIMDTLYGQVKPSKRKDRPVIMDGSNGSVKPPKSKGKPVKRQNPLTRQNPDYFNNQIKVNKKKHKSTRHHQTAEEEGENWRVELRKTTNYNPRDRKYRERDAQPVFESNFDEILKEDKRSRKIGKHEERMEKADNVEEDYSEEDE